MAQIIPAILSTLPSASPLRSLARWCRISANSVETPRPTASRPHREVLMRVLVIGGSGYVGSLVLPFLAERFTLRVFDRNPPADPGWDYAPGDITDPDTLLAAAQGHDALLYMAMGTTRGNPGINDAIPAYDVNVKGVHLALDAAVKAGIRRAVYTSSLSVYEGHLDIRSGASDTEEVPPEPRSTYGFTKRLGEEVGAFF